MSRPRRAAAAVLLVAAFATEGGSASAQAGRKGSGSILPGASARDPVSIEAGKLDYFDKEQKLVYTGDVRAKQGDTTLKASVLTIFLTKDAAKGGDEPSVDAKQAGTSVRRMEVAGPVTVVSKDEVGTGDSGVYDKGANAITLTGNVTLSQGANVIKGDTLTYDMNSGRAQVASGRTQGRVMSVFTPGSGAPGLGGAPAKGKAKPSKEPRRRKPSSDLTRMVDHAHPGRSEAGLLRRVADLLPRRRAAPIPEASPLEASGGEGDGPGSLEVHHLGKAYRSRQVVQDVSLAVRRGEAVGLLGPNGAGKTTVFYMITGLVRPDRGLIVLDGHDVTGLPMYRRARLGIGYLPQEASIFRGLTVEDNIRAVLEMTVPDRDRREAELDSLLDEFGIARLRKSPSVALSGGERRRCEIARALAGHPSFMLLDEPFAGIDPIAIGDIQDLVTHLKGRGIGVLITDHNVRETLGLIDRAYIIHSGRVLTEGSPTEIVADPDVRRFYLGEDFRL